MGIHEWVLRRIFLSFTKIGTFTVVHSLSRDPCELLNLELKSSRDSSTQRTWQPQGRRSATEALRWALAGGIYTGVKYGLQELRGVDDWKNSTIGGAVAGAVFTLTDPASRRDYRHVVRGAVGGASVATAGEILSTIAKFYGL